MIKIILVSGITVYFFSRYYYRLLLLFSKTKEKKNLQEKEKSLLSYLLILIEAFVVVIVIVQVFICNILIWNLPLLVKIFGVGLFVISVFINLYSRTVLGAYWATARDFMRPVSLVKKGIYKYVRHPIYSSTWFLGLGFELAIGSYLFFVVLVFGGLFIYIVSIIEEKKLIRWFPEEYVSYKRMTKRFIPFVF